MKLTLSRRIWVGLIGILLLAVLSSAVALFSARRAQSVYEDLISKNLEQARAISELQIAWLEQGELISFYLLDGQQKWVDELEEKKPDFELWLNRVNRIDLEEDQKRIFRQISEDFSQYKSQMEHIVILANQDELEQAKGLWMEKAIVSFDRIYDLCDQLNAANSKDIEKAITARRIQIKQVNAWIIIFIILLVGLSIGIVWSLLSGVFWPLKTLREKVRRDTTTGHKSVSSTDDVHLLSTYIDDLTDQMEQMRSHLSLSQRRLIDAEKLASIGKLAASIAHEIRSPLTALRLRLFSLQEAFQDHQRQRDFKLISGEITRLDKIVSNFLEFSRPRPLNLHQCTFTDLLDKIMDLLRYKLEAANINVLCQVEPNLPPVMADSQQLQQVFVNVLNNAMDVLTNGGTIRIIAKQKQKSPGLQKVIEILISDNGTGIPDEVQNRIFDPFFGTKSNGTGLGLWISQRIMRQHHGGIELRKSTRNGTVFAVWIPAAEREHDE